MTDRLMLLGDSHLVTVAHWLPRVQSDFTVFGNQLPLGPRWIHELHSDDTPLQFARPDAQRRFEDYAREAGVPTDDLMDLDMPLVFSFFTVEGLIYHWDWFDHYPARDPVRHFMSSGLLRTILTDHFAHLFRLFERLTAAGRTCYNLVSPGPRTNDVRRGELFLTMRDEMARLYTDMGVTLVDITDRTCDENGTLQKRYWSDMEDDVLHGNYDWGKAMAEACHHAVSCGENAGATAQEKAG